MNEKIIRLHGAHIKETIESLADHEEAGEITHMTVVAVMTDGRVMTTDSWHKPRPFTMLGGLDYMKAQVMSKIDA